MRALASLLGPCVALAAACGAGGDATPADGGTPDAGGGTDAGSFAPAPPTLTPCRDGWRELVADGVTLCEPWPEGGRRDDCAPDEAHFAGTPGCSVIGSACPADGWPADLPAGRAVSYVDASAPAGGNGATRATAFRGIGTAADSAPPNAVIAIRAGHYDEGEIYVGQGMTLWGACVSGTEIGSSSAVPDHGVVFLAEPGSAARNLRIESPERLGVVSMGMGSSLQDVVVHAARNLGVGATRGTLGLDHVVVAATRGGRGLEVQSGAVVTAHVLRVDAVTDVGLSLEGAGSRLDATDLAVSRTASRADGLAGWALAARQGAQATLTGAVLEGSGEYTVYLEGAGTRITATDLVVRDQVLPTAVTGLYASVGTTLEVTRARVENVRGTAFAAEGAGTRLVVADVVVRDVVPLASGAGRGLDVVGGGAIVADRLLVARPVDGAIACAQPGSTLDARDLRIVDPTGTASGDFGRGIVAFEGGVITVERADVRRAHDFAVTADGDGSSVTVHGLVVHEMLGLASDGTVGIAVWAQTGAQIALADTVIDGARMAGIGAIERGVVTAERTVVRGTLASACGATTCPDRVGGFGFVATYGGTVTATDFDVQGSALCGVVVGTGSLMTGVPSSLDLHAGVVSGSPVGACVQDAGYDSARLRDRVQYRDVGVPLQATSYTLPGAAAGL